MFSKICPICNNQFQTKNNCKIYCGAKCRNSVSNIKRKKIYEKICFICSEKFKTTNSLKKYCKKQCSYEGEILNKRQKTDIQIKCDICGKNFIGKSFNKYCSNECKKNARNIKMINYRKECESKNYEYYKIKRLLASRIRSAMKRQNEKKYKLTIELLGCSIQQFKSHIENLFDNNMTWDNQGEWHFDHIIPCSSFNLINEDEQKKCFHYTNLQPLWAKDNLMKSNKIIGGK